MSLTIDIPEPRAENEFDPAPAHDRSGLAELSEFYRQLGFDAGYSQAARDQLESSVVVAEQILREQNTSVSGPKDARRLLYAFIARVDRRLSLFANPAPTECRAEYMEGGLGI